MKKCRKLLVLNFILLFHNNVRAGSKLRSKGCKFLHHFPFPFILQGVLIWASAISVSRVKIKSKIAVAATVTTFLRQVSIVDAKVLLQILIKSESFRANMTYELLRWSMKLEVPYNTLFGRICLLAAVKRTVELVISPIWLS